MKNANFGKSKLLMNQNNCMYIFHKY